MSQGLNFSRDIASGQEITTKERFTAYSDVVFLFPEVYCFIGFLTYLFPYLIISRLIQRGGKQQSNLFLVSAGSDLRMSTLRPNPYLSIGVKMRKSKFRGFFQLFSRPN